jgi:hypothetical protein
MTYLKNFFNKRREIFGNNEDLNNIEEAMSAAGVSSDEDLRDFYYIGSYIPFIVKSIIGSNVTQEQLAQIAHEVYSAKEDYPINTIINLYKASKNAIDKLQIPIKKMAYPQVGGYFNIHPQHNIQFWIECMKKIYSLKSNGKDFNEAFEVVTKDWDNMNKNDFKHWLNFYQSGQHLNYKLAQVSDTGSGSYIPYGSLKATVPGIPSPVSFNEYKQREQELINEQALEAQKKEQAIQEKKLSEQEILKEKTKQLIGRLNSAEKIVTTNGFHNLLGESYQSWLEALMKLKRDLQVASIKNASTVEDLIYRAANTLATSGFVKSANLILKIAQEPPPVGGEPPPAPPGGEALPSDLPPIDDIGPSGPPGASDDSGKDLSDPEGAMREFLENIGVEIDEDEDNNDVHDLSVLADEDFDGAIISIEEPEIKVFAQEAITPEPVAPAPTPAEPKKDIAQNAPGASDDQTSEQNMKQKLNKSDDAIENAFKNITIEDVIARLEQVAILHKNRPVSRELSIVDLQLQELGIASYFPNLAEASKSALDSNQYVLTRIEDILAKLRGASSAGMGNMDALKDKLQIQEQNKDKRREDKEKADMVPGGPPQEGTEPTAPPPEMQKELETPIPVAPPNTKV